MTFTVANQWTITENSTKRHDIIIFLNGLPIVVIELKSPSREETDIDEAYLQLRNYMQEIPSLFTYNAFLVTSDQSHTKAGTITADERRFMEWKTKDGSYENTQFAQFDTFFEGMFEKARLLDIIKNFICFSGDAKILGAYHQYFAVRKAAALAGQATETDGKGGVFWHTQGSGKSLPNATYIGFTGTPISSKDRSTIEVFGNYIDIYDMTQAVEDGANRPVYYESRVIHLKLDEDILRLIDAEYDLMAESAEQHTIEKSKKELGRMESLLGAEETITALCEDIVKHYEDSRQYELTGKAMVVAYSRPIAMSIYNKLLELRPEWTEKVGVVMTEGNNDPEKWRGIIGNKRRRDELALKFKDDSDPMKIAIVVDMWLTGFDVPSLATMYVYKPMAGHNLMQAIARVNRVYKDKEGGLVVDYVGIASALKKAMNDFTNRDKNNFGDTDIAKTALPKFNEKLEVCRELMHGFDYSDFLCESASDLTRAKAISGGVNFLTAVKPPIRGGVGTNKKIYSASVVDKMVAEPTHLYLVEHKTEDKSLKVLFIKEAMLLRQALSLCRSLLQPDQRIEAAYFEAVRTLLTRVTAEGKTLTLKEINDHINELLKASIKSEGVINLFADINSGFSLFDPNFLEEISKMKERNLAVEILKKLLAEQVSLYKRTNLVKSEKFSERLTQCMKAYINGLISNEEVIAELMSIAKDMVNAQAEGDALGLSDEESAFYDALTRPEAVKDFYHNEQLVEMTRELTQLLRKSRTIDWQRKESARADMRRLVKRLLKKYNYPPEGVEGAIATVMGQCEIWADSF